MRSRDDAKPRAWNSTLPAPSEPMNRGSGLKKSGRLNPRNAERQAKASKRAASKHRAYMQSETRKAVDARAGGRCEIAVRMVLLDSVLVPAAIGANWEWQYGRYDRCEATDDLQHHHRTYARYGGKELPTDVIVACKPHHEFLEALKPAGNRRSRSQRSGS